MKEIDRDQGLLDSSGLGKGITASTCTKYKQQAGRSHSPAALTCSAHQLAYRVPGNYLLGVPGSTGAQSTPYF
jgi:hypothetical protein